MDNKGKSIFILFPVGVFAVLLLILNIAVLVQGRVSLRQMAGQEPAGTEIYEEGQQEDGAMASEFAGFRIERTLGASDVSKGAGEGQALDGNYLCAQSIVRVLTMEDVENLKNGTYEGLPKGKGIIQMVVNEIYARNGYQFENEEIQAYFSAKSWYQADSRDARDMDAIYKKMSDIDKANIDFLKEVRQGI